MPKFIQRLLLPLAILIAIVVAKPGLSAEPAAPAEAAPVESHLTPAFWVADPLDLRDELARHSLPLAPWISQLNQSRLDFICLGETHTRPFRTFLAEQVFPLLDVDVLMIEADAERAAQLLAQVTAEDSTAMLLGADLAPIIRAVRARNPQVQIIGVEETDQQKRWRNLEQANSPRRRLSRDGFIAQNIVQAFQPNQRTVALYGANHCASHDLGLGNARPFFRHLAGAMAPRDRMKSILLFSAAPPTPLAIALERSGLQAAPLVIPDSQAIRPETYNYRWDLTTPFDNFDALIYFPG